MHTHAQNHTNSSTITRICTHTHARKFTTCISIDHLSTTEVYKKKKLSRSMYSDHSVKVRRHGFCPRLECRKKRLHEDYSDHTVKVGRHGFRSAAKYAISVLRVAKIVSIMATRMS